MVNIIVWSNTQVDMENKSYEIRGQDDMAIFIKDLLDKVYYSGETICLETATLDFDKGEALYTELERWK